MADASRRSGTGRAAAGIGLLIGAHIGLILGGVVGLFIYLPFRSDTGGGFDALIGAFFGALVGMVAGGALGSFIGLRSRWYPHPGRTALAAAVLLTVGLGVFFAVWSIGSDSDVPGWWYLIALEGPVIGTAALVRVLTPLP